MYKKFAVIQVFLAVLVVASCTQSKVKKEEYSGFLGDYSKLQAAKSTDGEPVMRWVSADLKSGHYSQIMLDPVVLYPEPKPSEHVSEQALNTMTMKLEDNLRRELGAELPLVSSPAPQTLRLRVALTGVDISNKGFKPYEIMPIALVVKGALLATGNRTQEVGLFMELEVTDAESGKLLAQVVRKSFGENLSNKDKDLTQQDVDAVLNNWAKNLRTVLHDLK